MEFVSTSSGTKTKDNIFVDKVKIASATVKHDTKEDWQTYSDNISIHLTLDIGRDFQPNMYIGGSFKTDEVPASINLPKSIKPFLLIFQIHSCLIVS